MGKDSESEVADHLYELILELHAIDSSVLLAVMPQLEFKLKVSIILKGWKGLKARIYSSGSLVSFLSLV